MMNRKIKLIWDFRGPDSKQVAEHHCRHLKDFIRQESLKNESVDLEILTEYHCLAFLVVKEENMLFFRDALRPHRAEIAK